MTTEEHVGIFWKMELFYVLIVMVDTELHILANSHNSELKLKRIKIKIKSTHTASLSMNEEESTSSLPLFLVIFSGLILLIHMVSSMLEK